MTEVFLRTPRLILRRFTTGDVDNLVELDRDPQVMRFLTGGKPTPRPIVENTVLPRILDEYERLGGLGWFAAEHAGAFVGWMALRPPGPDRLDEAELGYRLHRAVWGRGLATEGSRALVHKAFTELGVRRVFATTMAVNTASRRVMERVGLVHVRTFHLHFDDPIPGTEHGEVEYELLASGPNRGSADSTDLDIPGARHE
jgi:RimJ/RimL family protein N-acetyltransferase